MSKALMTQQQDLERSDGKLKLEALQAIVKGEITTIEELVEQSGMPLEKVMSLVSDPDFVGMIASFSKGKALFAYHLQAIPRAIELVNDDDGKIALSAIKFLSEATGNRESKNKVDVHVSLEQQIAKQEETTTVVDAIENWSDAEIEEEETIPSQFRKY